MSEIKEIARRQLAESGASSLSLRAIARELGMVSSALYRYFASRDELLTALIIDAYDDLGAKAEGAVPARGRFEDRFVTLASTVRDWALANPQDYALVYGSPVPGYRAPIDTVAAAARVSVVGLQLVADAVSAGEIDTADTEIPRAVRRQLGPIREIVPAAPDGVILRALAAWSEMFGAISLELFGHLENVIDDKAAYFAFQMREAARSISGTSR